MDALQKLKLKSSCNISSSSSIFFSEFYGGEGDDDDGRRRFIGKWNRVGSWNKKS
jgi:hypothetical protein